RTSVRSQCSAAATPCAGTRTRRRSSAARRRSAQETAFASRWRTASCRALLLKQKRVPRVPEFPSSRVLVAGFWFPVFVSWVLVPRFWSKGSAFLSGLGPGILSSVVWCAFKPHNREPEPANPNREPEPRTRIVNQNREPEPRTRTANPNREPEPRTRTVNQN